jgi:alkyl hydroperoxide reductase subunit AhpC
MHRAVIRAYGVHDEERNVAYRSTFIVDREGVLRWGQAGDRDMVRDGVEILRVLDVIAPRLAAQPAGDGAQDDRHLRPTADQEP